MNPKSNTKTDEATLRRSSYFENKHNIEDTNTTPDMHIRSLSIPELPTIPLLDKVTVSNIDVIGIHDIDKLVSMGVIEQHYGVNNCFHLPDGTSYSRLQIKNTELFDCFTQSFSGKNIPTSYLELSIDEPYIHNLIGATLDQYKHRLYKIQQYLCQQYGIIIDLHRATFKYMEIQKTILLDEDCSMYSRAIALLMNDIPKIRKLKGLTVYYSGSSGPSEKYIQSCSRSSSKYGLEIIAYDKGAQLDRKNYPREEPSPSNILRIELKLKSKQFIQRHLGTSCVWDLTDDDIIKYYENFVIDNFDIPYNYNSDARINTLIPLIQAIQAESYHWIKDSLMAIAIHELDHYVPMMLDIKELLQALDAIGNVDPKKKYYIHKSVMKICQKRMPPFIRGDDIKCKKLIYIFSTSTNKHHR